MNESWRRLLSGISLKPHTSQVMAQPFFCPLTDYGVIQLHGVQSQEYLQGQLTCDIHRLTSTNHLMAAHCDAKGKMWAILNLCVTEDHYLLTGHNDEVAASLAQLQKYGVFAKTEITDQSEYRLAIGLAGKGSEQWLNKQWQVMFDEQNSAADIEGGKVLKMADHRFLLLLTADAAEQLLQAEQQRLYGSSLWHKLNIEAGIAHLTEPSIGQYVPQMLNLQSLDAISFDKGCYSGQEMVARMKYLGKNKRAAYILTGKVGAQPKDGDEIQLAIGENWRRSGAVINSAGSNDQCYLLAVLPNDLPHDARLRLKDDEQSALTIETLPYSLDAEQIPPKRDEFK